MSLTLHAVPAVGTEDVVVGTTGRDEGAVFTGTEDGTVWRLAHDGGRVTPVGTTGGRPLGLELGPDGRLLVCDAAAGLLWLDPASGRVETILDSIDGVRMRFCNNAAITNDGTIWFSDSSRVHSIDRWRHDFVQHTRTGRLVRRDPDGGVEVVLDGMSFANGVALAADESFVAVAETRTRRVVRHWLSGERVGTRDHLVSDLPGYPDNVARGSDGLIWVTLASPVDALVERLDRTPRWVRRSVTAIPERLQPQPKRTVRVQGYDDAGTLVRDLDLPADDFHMVTGVREHDGRVWLGSLVEPAIAVADL